MSMVMVKPTASFTRIRLKLCGLTRTEDIAPMVESGADAIGMVFYPPSQRCISPEQAGRLAAQIPAFVTTVGLFVNPAAHEEIGRASCREGVYLWGGDGSGR